MTVTTFPIPVRSPRSPPPTYEGVVPGTTFDTALIATSQNSSNPYQRPASSSSEAESTCVRVATNCPGRNADAGNIFKSSAKYVVVVLYNLSTLGIPSLYRRHYGNFPRSFTGEMNTLGPPCNITIGDLDQLPLYNCISNDPYYTEQLWRDTFSQIEAGWKTLLAVSTTAVLGCAVGFVQLLTACNNVLFRTVVLSAFILVWGSFVSGTYYIGRRDKFLSLRWMNNWKQATCNDCGFWTQIALPALLSAWAGILCIFAIVVVAVTGFCEGRVKLDGPLVASCTVIALVFITTIGLIWNAVKKINASPNMQ